MVVLMQLAHISLQHGKVLSNYCQSLPIVVFRSEIGVTSSAPVLERACCKVAKHGQHLAKQYVVVVHWICGVRLQQHIRTRELHGKLGIISVTEESDGEGLDTLATSREWIRMFGQEE